MLICWDLAFPEAFRELIYQGAKIIIIPTFCKAPFVIIHPVSPIVIGTHRCISRDSQRLLTGGSQTQRQRGSPLPRLDRYGSHV